MRHPIIRTKRTVYGRKAVGLSHFIVIAPHAAGDDLKTGRLARYLTKFLNSFVIINKRYFKPTNPKAKLNPGFAEDFNKLSWSRTKNRWLWKQKKPAMKIFYDDISVFCDEIKQKHGCKPICIYLHSLKNKDLGIDIGMGLRSKNGKNRFIGSSRSCCFSGVPTIQIRQLKQLKKMLQRPIKKVYNLDIGVGNIYSAWDKRSGIQFHKHGGRDEYALQIEINTKLKEKEEDIIYISRLLAQIFKKVF